MAKDLLVVYPGVKSGGIKNLIMKYVTRGMEKAVIRLIEIMEKEVEMPVHGNGPGRTEWRRQMAASMHKVYTVVADQYIEYGVGLDLFKNNIGYIQAMIVTEGSGFWVGNPAISAGPTGRNVFDKELNTRQSEALTEWSLPPEFNQPGNDWLQSSRDIFEREFADIITGELSKMSKEEVIDGLIK